MTDGVDLLSSSSALMNNRTTKDDKDSYCNNFLHFEIPEGLDISEFMRNLSIVCDVCKPKVVILESQEESLG